MIDRLIEALHHAGRPGVLAVTGGGAAAAGRLLTVPGASRSILEVIVPYHEQALSDFLGHRPEQFCSAETTRAMAVRAWERAQWLAPAQAVIGLGCTASLATDRPKRGDHRFHVAVHTGTQTTTYSLTLSKGARDRQGEEAVLDAVLLNALAEACGLEQRLDVPLLPGEAVQTERQPAPDPLAAFLRGEVPTVCVEVDGWVRADAPRPALLLPGSFNPLHRGHRELAAVAERRTGRATAFELSVTNVDKPPLPAEEVRRRVAQFTWYAPLWLTRAPMFAEKARLFPGTAFVIGADTAVRLVAPRYYQDSPLLMAAALKQIREQGCRFLVAGRCDAAGRFVTLADLPMPAEFRDLFEGIPEAEFHLDLSSTQLREQVKPAAS
jgi:nicotinamide mononucleotide (NMN) deamidase PncC